MTRSFKVYPPHAQSQTWLAIVKKRIASFIVLLANLREREKRTENYNTLRVFAPFVLVMSGCTERVQICIHQRLPILLRKEGARTRTRTNDLYTHTLVSRRVPGGEIRKAKNVR